MSSVFGQVFVSRTSEHETLVSGGVSSVHFGPRLLRPITRQCILGPPAPAPAESEAEAGAAKASSAASGGCGMK